MLGSERVEPSPRVFGHLRLPRDLKGRGVFRKTASHGEGDSAPRNVRLVAPAVGKGEREGAASVSLEVDVAAARGGGGEDQPTRVHLRTFRGVSPRVEGAFTGAARPAFRAPDVPPTKGRLHQSVARESGSLPCVAGNRRDDGDSLEELQGGGGSIEFRGHISRLVVDVVDVVGRRPRRREIRRVPRRDLLSQALDVPLEAVHLILRLRRDLPLELRLRGATTSVGGWTGDRRSLGCLTRRWPTILVSTVDDCVASFADSTVAAPFARSLSRSAGAGGRTSLFESVRFARLPPPPASSGAGASGRGFSASFSESSSASAS